MAASALQVEGFQVPTQRTLRRPSHPSKQSLRQCQVSTPPDVVKLTWDLVRERRPTAGTVVDFGAGFCQFATGGHYTSYVGVEIDANKATELPLPSGARLVHADALDFEGAFDVAIGNPPYTRHHLIGKRWRKHAHEIIKGEAGYPVSELANLYLYFAWLSLLRTKADGLIALVIPYEWVSRPSATSLRTYLKDKGYRVDVYRFEEKARVFAKVKTTACITLIDKSATEHQFNCWELKGGRAMAATIAPGLEGVLPYEKGTKEARAFRGLSPGSQDVFLLTEEQRIMAGIPRSAVVPCISSLRALDSRVLVMDQGAFDKHYIKAGRKCWLVKTQPPLDPRVYRHLAKTPKRIRENWTCRNRTPWYRFDLPPIPDIIYASGFRGKSPRAVVNTVKARVSGSSHGIILPEGADRMRAVRYVRAFPFADRVVAHANGLLKVEVRQMNSVLKQYLTESEGEPRGAQTGS